MTQSNEAPEKVLATLNKDGSRNWLRPRLSVGFFHTWRRRFAWFLIFIFLLLPHVRIGGEALFLFDIPNRRFTIFGITFLPTDTLLLLFAALAFFLGVFLITAMLGRAWCGWACPQTVYMEFLFRPIERMFEGSSPSQQKRIQSQGLHWRSLAKYFTYIILAMVLAHTFLAYFVGTDELRQWMTQSPFKHPQPFAIMLLVTGAVFFDFAYFREQTCLVVCPYGRFQSVLLDRQSMIVGYDPNRGETRGKVSKRKKEKEVDFGDCIDCGACVTTCPTGIDIRDGLQMECINCTQCIDACDKIMTKLNKPTGLIRYTSQDELEGKKQKFLRPRVVLYPLLILLVITGFIITWNYRSGAKIQLVRQGKSPYRILAGGEVSNQVAVAISNLTKKSHKYKIELYKKDKGIKMIAPVKSITVGPSKIGTLTVFITTPAKLFETKTPVVQFRVTDGAGLDARPEYKLIGPLPIAGN